MHTHPFPARARAQLIASDVSLTRGTSRVLSHVDLTLSPASRVAIVGENGQGKSSLLHVLAGSLQPTSGSVRLVGTIGVAEQEMDASDNRTVGEAVAESIEPALAALEDLNQASHALTDASTAAAEAYSSALAQAEALDAWDAERRVLIALEALDAETDMARPLATLSVGQRYRVRLACLLGTQDDFLLLDEPTNHLDRSGLDFLTTSLRARLGGVVVVSHDRALLADVAQTVVDLDPSIDGRPRTYGNGYAGYLAGRRAEQERWEQDYARQQEERSRLQDSLSAAQNRLVTGWRPDKGTNKHGRATRAGGLVQSVRRRQADLDAHTVDVPVPPQRFSFPELSARAGTTLLAVEGVSFRGRLEHPTSFSVSRGERLVVTGPNGAGKSTLLAIAAGELRSDSGEVRLAAGSRLGYLRQESRLPMARRASDVFGSHVAALVAARMLPESEAIGLSQLGLLKPRERAKRVGELSMGQQRRLDLALMLASRPNVLLLDEPTNQLSIALVDELTEALQATEAAVVLSTHDRQLLRDLRDWPLLGITHGSPQRPPAP